MEKLLRLEQSKTGQLICVFLVLIHHWTQKESLDYNSLLSFFEPFKYIGGCACCGFFFLSGYGLFESYQKDSNLWLTTFLRKRMVKVFFPFFLFCLLYYVLWITKGGYRFDLMVFVKSVLGANLVINGHFWFMQCMLLLYWGLYCILKFINIQHRKIQIFCLFVYQCLLILILGKVYGYISSFAFFGGV